MTNPNYTPNPECVCCSGSGTDPAFLTECTECWPTRGSVRDSYEFRMASHSSIRNHRARHARQNTEKVWQTASDEFLQITAKNPRFRDQMPLDVLERIGS